MERFYSISSGRILLYKILAFKGNEIEISAIYGVVFEVFALKIFNNRSKHPQGIFLN